MNDTWHNERVRRYRRKLRDDIARLFGTRHAGARWIRPMRHRLIRAVVTDLRAHRERFPEIGG
jgi:plasmid stabilization system protein ParE